MSASFTAAEGVVVTDHSIPRPAINKPLVTRALEKLGADRVMRGHVALEHGTVGDWNGCFLAMCYGGYGQLAKVAEFTGNESDLNNIGNLLGLTFEEVYATVDAYDHCPADFQALVEEWLELNVVKVVPMQMIGL